MVLTEAPWGHSDPAETENSSDEEVYEYQRENSQEIIYNDDGYPSDCETIIVD